MRTGDWCFAFLLHNLTLGESVETDHVVALSHKDPHRAALLDAEPMATVLAERFSDSFGRPRSPTPVFVRTSAPRGVWTWEGLASWRNVYAVGCLLRSWQTEIRHKHGLWPLYSDFFEIHPVLPGGDGNDLVARSTALLALDRPERFRGQTSPGLPGTEHMNVVPDDLLWRELLACWTHRYVTNGPSKFNDSVLRSLDMAFQAMRMPGDNGASVFEFGSRVALWVSAFETLVHPLRDHANLDAVLDHLDRMEWSDDELRRKQFRPDKAPPLTLAQEIYRQLYDARNAFLHGNPVTFDRLFAFRDQGNLLLTQLAPLLYWFALAVLFVQAEDDLEGIMNQMSTQGDYETALLSGAGVARV